MNFAVETEQEADGRWIAEIPQIPGAMAYGADRQEAISRVEALALRILADGHSELAPSIAGAHVAEVRDASRKWSLVRWRSSPATRRWPAFGSSLLPRAWTATTHIVMNADEFITRN